MPDLTTLADVKEYLDIKVDDAEHDIRLKGLIEKASEQIEKYCNRAFANKFHYDKYDGTASDILFLEYSPIVSVIGLWIDHTSIPSEDFQVFDGYIRLKSALFQPGDRNVHVGYVAGYYDPATEAPPSDIADACIHLTAFKFSLCGSSDGFSDIAIPLSVAIILDKYRKPRAVE